MCRHYNSFHPTLGFFLHLDDVISQVESGNISCVSFSRIIRRPHSRRKLIVRFRRTARRQTNKSAKEYEQIFKLPLTSHYTGAEYKTIPKLKEHLEAEFARRAKAAKAAAGWTMGEGTKRTSSPPWVDEDGFEVVQKKKQKAD